MRPSLNLSSILNFLPFESSFLRTLFFFYISFVVFVSVPFINLRGRIFISSSSDYCISYSDELTFLTVFLIYGFLVLF